MNWIYIFVTGIIFCAGIIIFLIGRLYRVRDQLSMIQEALQDIRHGNMNRRILTRDDDMVKDICRQINAITANSQTQIVRLNLAEQRYKQLMTGLSHDVKTPLTSLVGYLEAVQDGKVSGAEKEAYINVALDKAHDLQRFVESLFEWVRLDAGERPFQLENTDLNELSREILAGWIPVLESSHFTYQIEIPETEYFLQIDRNACTRIYNNLIENVLYHSQGNAISLRITENDACVEILLTDNGKGVPIEDLPYIFERLYQADKSRAGRGNGLGLAIVKELVAGHGGSIKAENLPESGIAFTVTLPKNRLIT